MADVIIIRKAAAAAFHPRFALAKMRFRILFAHPGHVLLSSHPPLGTRVCAVHHVCLIIVIYDEARLKVVVGVNQLVAE